MSLIRKLCIGTVLTGLTLASAGCATHAGEGALIGGGTGALIGAGIGSLSHGRAGEGAAIGAGAGAIIGALIGNEQDQQERYGRYDRRYDDRPVVYRERVYSEPPPCDSYEYRRYDTYGYGGGYRETYRYREYRRY